MSPRLEPPRHLQPIVDVFESCMAEPREPRKVVLSTPPQHGKTITTAHALVWAMRRAPTLRHAYATYAQDRAEEVSLDVETIAADAGLGIVGSRKRWITRDHGSVKFTGVGGPLTGAPVDGLLVVDDPVKNSAEAESSAFREHADRWFREVAMTRVHPGASAVVISTRWHPDDLAGRLVDRGWEYINLPAIDDAGRALWPERRPIEWLNERRADVGEYAWASLYQGQPRPRGGALFNDVHFYTALPPRYRVGIGFDLAYTAKTHADYSAAVVLAEADGLYYVLDVRRMQVAAPDFAGTLKMLKVAHPGARMHWFTSTTEKGLAEFLRDQTGLPVVPELAQADKFVRAQPVAAAWNAGKVLLPQSAPWLEAFVSELAIFTGVNDRHDDQVDALSSAFAALHLKQAPDLRDLTVFQKAMPPRRFSSLPTDDWDS